MNTQTSIQNHISKNSYCFCHFLKGLLGHFPGFHATQSVSTSLVSFQSIMKTKNVPGSDAFKMYHIKEQNKESIGSFHPDWDVQENLALSCSHEAFLVFCVEITRIADITAP